MSGYSEYPWRALYATGIPHTIEAPFTSALDMFKNSSNNNPNNVGIWYFDTPISLSEMDKQSDALACALLARGFQHGDRLAVYMQNLPQFVISMLATWKAGGVMVSVNPMNKERELETLLLDSGARVLVTQEALWKDVARGVVDSGTTAIDIVVTTNEIDYVVGEVPTILKGSKKSIAADASDMRNLISEFSGKVPPAVSLKADEVAFLTYTSGTTGPPKGARNTHGNVVFNSATFQKWMDLTDKDIVLGVAPLFHITGLIAHIAVSFLVPMPLVLGYRFDAPTILDLIEKHKPTFTVGAITVFIALISDPTAAGRDFSSLQKVYSGGAPIAPSVIERFQSETGAYIHNIYGLTETTSPSHAVPMGALAPVDPTSGALSVGVPVFNTMVRIVDENGKDVAVGEIGEIVSSGPQVVSGYWNKPEETAHAIPGGELFTGDVGFMDSNGWFYIVDRKKDQINASGYKVWPREVEDVLYEHSAVREAAVIGIPDDYRGETVKAFVSLRPGESVTEAVLIAFCKERMAAYKYPREIEFIDELPKTVTGKILRRELRAAELAKRRK